MPTKINNKYIGRSSISYFWVIIGCLFNYIIWGLIHLWLDNTLVNVLSYLCYLIIFSETINYLRVYNDRLTVTYLFRIFNRIKIYDFKTIEKVIYINYSHANDYPRLKFVFQYKSKLELPSNTFAVYSFNQRKRILNFLNLKGIPIEINSDKEKELNILSE